MTDHQNVQDENLINDQVLQDLGASPSPQPTPAAAPGTATPAPAAQEETLIPAPAGIGAAPQPEQEAPESASPTPAEEPEEDTEDAAETPESNAKTTTTTPIGHGNGDDDELLDVKKRALEDLSPLVDKLDLEPKERFQTIMEILQASDDRTLVKPALEAAEGIEDEAERAQALLDVVNEVNYLTQEDN